MVQWLFWMPQPVSKWGTEKVWGFADEQALPRIIYISRMDKERANFFKVIEEISRTFETKLTPLFLPIGEEDKFSGLIDLVKMKAHTYSKDGSGKFETGDIPADMADLVDEWREKIIENIVEANDELMEKYLEGEELTPREIEDTLLQGVKAGVIVPVTCGASTLNMGVCHLMDLIVQAFPSPLDKGSKTGVKPGSEDEVEMQISEDAPFSALVFKTIADPFAGKLTLLRVISGILKADSTIYNANKDVKEKFGQLLLMEGKKQQSVESAGPGEIVAIAKLKETATGDTLCTDKAPVIYKPVSALPSVISYAVEAKVAGTEDKIFSSLSKLCEEDPTLRLERIR